MAWLAASRCGRSLARLERAPSTVAREVKGNGGRHRYRACRADADALGRARRPKPSKLATCERLRAVVEDRLEQRWSPQQIAGWLPLAFPEDPEMRVSHETIYLSLFVQARGALRKELTRYLRSGHATRRPGATRSSTVKVSSEGPSTSANVRPRPRTGRCRAIGKATFSSAKGCGPSPPSSNARPASCSSSPCPTATRPRSSPTPSPPRSPSSHRAAPVPHLGPRQRDGRPCPLQHRDRRPRLLL